jgi:ABC-type branched-subunit amino acid transport system ATPase component
MAATTESGSAVTDVLSADGITVRFSGLSACRNVSIAIARGQFVGLVGPNGAGKSTLFSVLSGFRRPNQGSVSLVGTNVTGYSPQRRARLGLARTFQQPELFAELTVREHLVLAYRSIQEPHRLWSDMFLAGSLRRGDTDEAKTVDRLIEDLQLAAVADRLAATLPLGTSRLLEVGRALAVRPSVLLLDEPLSGLDANEAAELVTTLRAICTEQAVALLLVEHDVAAVLDLCSKIYVLDFGVLIASGTPDEIRSDPGVRAAYLGDADVIATASDSED